MNVSMAINDLDLPSKDLSVNQAIRLMNYLVKDGGILSKDQLRDIANRVLADTGSPDSITVLFSGSKTYDGVSTAEILTELDQSNTNLRLIGRTPAAQFLRSDSFLLEVSRSFGIEISEINSNVDSSDFLNGVDGLWGDVSANFVENTKGIITGIIGENASEARIFSQRELPKILDNPNITKIFGFDPNELKSLDLNHPEMFSFLVKQSNIMIKASHLTNSSGGTSSLGARIFIQDVSRDFVAFVDDRPDLFANASNYIESMSIIDQQAYKDFTIREAEKKVIITNDMDGNKFKYIGPIGKVLLVLGLLVVSTQAGAAELSGDHEGAKKIIKDWAIEASGSLAGELIGAAVTGLVTAGLVGAGVLSAPIAGALVLAGALVGGIYGADAAKELYELTKDQDENGRRDLYDRIINVMYGAQKYITSPLMFDLDGGRHTLDANLTQKQILTFAQTEISWRFTLRELNPFVVTDVEYDRFNDDHSLDLYNTQHDLGMTKQYLADRSAMLTWFLQYYTGQQDADDQPHDGVKPYNEEWDTNEIEGNWDFIDLSIKLEGGAPLTLAIDGRGISFSDHQVVFGSKEADTITGAGVEDYLYGAAGDDVISGEDDRDYLEGGAGKDKLYGGDGNDTLFAMADQDILEGGRGNDWLQGGLEVDEYVFSGSFGNDTVIDIDGLGFLKVDDVIVKVGTRLGDYLWESSDQKLHIAAVPDFLPDGTSTIKVIIARKNDPNNSITIKNWAIDSLGLTGIQLSNQNQEDSKLYDERYVSNLSDFLNPNFPHVDYIDLDENQEKRPEYVIELKKPQTALDYYDHNIRDEIFVAEKNQYQAGLETFNLFVVAGEGSDIIETGEGHDQIAVDHIYYNPYKIRIVHGSSGGQSTWETRLANPHNTQGVINGNFWNYVESHDGDDYIFGGYGNDQAYGGDDNDSIFGRGNSDVLNGDHGDDVINGDGYLVREFAPIGLRKPTGVTAEDLKRDLVRAESAIAPIENDINATNSHYHGDDDINGGAGKDLIYGEGGDDELYGGDDDDLLSGDAIGLNIVNRYFVNQDPRDYWDWEFESQSAEYQKNFVLELHKIAAIQLSGEDKLYGGDGNDYIGSGGGQDWAYGGIGNDLIFGDRDFSSLNDLYETKNITVEEQAGKVFSWYEVTGAYDISFTEAERDQLYSHAKDFLYGGEGNDHVFGDGGNDQIEGGEGDDELIGDNDKDKLNAKYHGNDNLFGGNGNDEIFGLGGKDNVYGGEGDDYLDGDAHISQLDAKDSNDDYLDGGTGADTLIGGGGKDRLYGGDGNDTINGDHQQVDGQYHKDDIIYAGLGDDVIIGDGAADTIYGGLGDDSISGDSSLLDISWHGNDFIDGEEGNDTIFGGGKDDHLEGSEGNDYLSGDDGIDVLNGGVGDDTLYGGNDNDTLSGEDGHDNLVGGAGNDTLIGFSGDDDLEGGDGNDTLNGGEGLDVLVGGAGDDQITDDMGSSVVDGGAGQDTITTGDGIDNIDGGTGDDNIQSGAGHDLIYAGHGNDSIIAGSGNDKVYGGNGDDHITSGIGNDQLYGGSGQDTYYFNLDDGIDTIYEEMSDLEEDHENFVKFNFESSTIHEVLREGFDLIIRYSPTDMVRVINYYQTKNHSQHHAFDPHSQKFEVSSFEFSDGVIWTEQDIFALAAPPEEQDDHDPLAGVAYFINALISREKIALLDKQIIYYGFANQPKNQESGLIAYTDEQKNAVAEALRCFEKVLNIQFIAANAYTQPDLTFFMDDLNSEGLGAAAGYANSENPQVHMNSRLYGESDALNIGTFGFQILLHEIGHVLGLKHPFESPVLPIAENNTSNTLMSYTNTGVIQTDLMLFDVAALQYLYGVNNSKNTENSTYNFTTKYIEDASGTDVFDVSTLTQNVTINLSEGGWSFIGTQASSILAPDQTFIGYGSIVENAKSGTGHDHLIGNQVNNSLYGGGGNDILAGAAGNDHLYGGVGVDTYYFDQSGGQDRIYESDAVNNIQFNVLSESMIYKNGSNVYYSSGSYVYGDLAKINAWTVNGITYNYTEFMNKISEVVTYSTSAQHIFGVDQLRGVLLNTASKSSLIGNVLNNVLYGNNNENILDGASGADIMLGGDNNDTYHVNHVEDQVIETINGGDDDQVISYIDYQLVEFVENLTLATLGSAISGTGNELNNTIIGNQLDNVLDGKGGADILRGGLGNDTYMIDQAGDQISESYAEGEDTVVSTINFSLNANMENLILQSGYFAYGNHLNNKINANQNQNELKGGAGDDQLYALGGHDLLYADEGSDLLAGGRGDDKLYGGSGSDRYEFSIGDGEDVILDVLSDSDMNILNFKDVNSENVRIAIEDNNFVIYYGDQGDQILIKDFIKHINTVERRYHYGEEFDVHVQKIQVNDFIQKLVFANGQERTIASYFDAITMDLVGTDLDEEIIGASIFKNVISADSGHDFIEGGIRADEIYAGLGDDRVNGKDGDNRIYGGDGNDNLSAGYGDDVIDGGTGIDHIYAGDGDNQVSGSSGNDHIETGLGNDLVYGGVDDDHISASSGTDILYGGTGNDYLYSGDGNDQQLFGDQGQDVLVTGLGLNSHLYGGSEDDYLGTSGQSTVLYGGDAADSISTSGHEAHHNSLYGGQGNDRLSTDGATYQNTLFGGEGYDIYDLRSGLYSSIKDQDVTGKIILDSNVVYIPWDKNETYDRYDLAINSLSDINVDFVRSESIGNTRTLYYQFGLNAFRCAYFYYDTIAQKFSMRLDRDVGLGLLQGMTDFSYFEILDIGNVDSLSQWMDYDIEFLENRSLKSGNDNVVIQGNTISFADFINQGGFLSKYDDQDNIIHGLTNYAGSRVTVANDPLGLSAAQVDVLGDTIYAGAGQDQIFTGIGSSLVHGQEGHDYIVAQDVFAEDRIYGGTGEDTIYTYDPNLPHPTPEADPHLELYGVGGNQPYNSSRDEVYGGDGDDAIYLGHQATHAYGGTGDDVIQAMTPWLGYHSFYSFKMFGDEGNDYIVASGYLYGGDGNDHLIAGELGAYLAGGLGVDTLKGSSGDDTYIVDGFDILDLSTENGGVDELSADFSVNLGQYTMVENASVYGSQNLSVIGNGLKNTLTGNDGDNYLDGGVDSVSDRLIGGEGGDYYVVRANDTISEDGVSGVDTIERWVNTSSDLNSSIENLVLKGSVINGYGNNQNNVITGNAVNNTIRLGDGYDQFVYEKGGKEDRLYADDYGTMNIDDFGSLDTILIKGYQKTDVYAVREGNNLIIRFVGSSSDKISIMNHFESNYGPQSATYNIDRVDFESGASLSKAELNTMASIAANNQAPVVTTPINDLVVVDGTAFSVLLPTFTDDKDTATLNYGWSDDSLFYDGYLSIEEVLINGVYRERLIGKLPEGRAGSSINLEYTATDSFGITTRESFDISFIYQNLILTGEGYLEGGSGEDLLYGGHTSVDELYGNGNHDQLFGLGGQDYLYGGAGNDLLDGGAEDDEMIGGIGDDTYVVERLSDSVVELENQGVDQINAAISYVLLDYIENLQLLTGTSALTATGNSIDNQIFGNELDNTLLGLMGNDLLSSGVGQDLLYGGSGQDHLYGGEGNDYLEGGLDIDQMVGGSGDDLFLVDHTNEVVIELADGGIDHINSTVDYVLPEYVESITLLSDSSALSVAGHNGSSTITGNQQDNLISAKLGIDIIYGEQGNDLLLGDGGNDTIYGGDGDDRLDGGTGLDTMFGGKGDDVYIRNAVGDVVSESENEGVDRVDSAMTYTLGLHVEHLTLTGSSVINGTGNDLSNTIVGNLADNLIYGVLGHDTLFGHQANDQLYGGGGQDSLYGGDGDDYLDGGTNFDTMVGGSGNDTYVVNLSSDIITELSGEGQDTIYSQISLMLNEHVENLTLIEGVEINGTGNLLDNNVVGNNQLNTLYGAAGHDYLDAKDGNDLIYGGQGQDRILGGLGDDTAYGGSENDQIDGGGGRDILYGGDGDDYLDGNTNVDTLIGGVGDDVYIVNISSDIVAELFAEGVDSVYSNASFILGQHVENLTLINSAHINGTGNLLNNVITGNDGANALDGKAGNDVLVGGFGDDQYLFGRGYEQDQIVESDDVVGGIDIMKFSSDVRSDQIWLRQVGSDLEMSIIGTLDSMLIKDWFVGSAHRIERFQSGDQKILTNTNIQVLIDAMSGLTPPPLGETSLSTSYQNQLNGVLAYWMPN